jgi:hypothetical protein
MWGPDVVLQTRNNYQLSEVMDERSKSGRGRFLPMQPPQVETRAKLVSIPDYPVQQAADTDTVPKRK